jgi:prepilin-type processing-associated H-X9-DG protein
MHSGGFNVVMCDESVHFFAETVEYRIYAVLMTSHGIKANDPNNPVSANQLPEPDWQDPTCQTPPYPGTKFK